MSTRDTIIEQLFRYRRNDLSPKEKAAIEKRLADDSSLREMLNLIDRLAAVASDPLDPDIVKATDELADRIYQDYFMRGRKSRVPVGVTVFDSKLLPIPAGVRPAAVDTRQLRYRLDDAEVILMLYPVAPDSYEIMGQFGEGLSEDCLTLTITNRGFSAKAVTDEFGLFRFERVPVGTYRLAVSTDTRAVGLIHVTI